MFPGMTYKPTETQKNVGARLENTARISYNKRVKRRTPEVKNEKIHGQRFFVGI